jgi:hypothetical protein
VSDEYEKRMKAWAELRMSAPGPIPSGPSDEPEYYEEDMQQLRTALAAAERRASEAGNCFLCPDCWRTSVDEDGCCRTCGRDCVAMEDGKVVYWPADEHDDALTAQLERLRGALRSIADHEHSYSSHEGNCDCPSVAHAALAADEGGEGAP